MRADRTYPMHPAHANDGSAHSTSRFPKQFVFSQTPGTGHCKMHYTCNVMQCNVCRIFSVPWKSRPAKSCASKLASRRSQYLRPTFAIRAIVAAHPPSHSPNRLIGTRIAPLVARVSSLHEALVRRTVVVAALHSGRHCSVSASPPRAHLGLFLTGPLQRIWHPGLILMRAKDVGTENLRYIRDGGSEAELRL